MPEITVRQSVAADGAIIAANLRECDRAELEASTSVKPVKAITDSIRLSAAAWTAEIDGIPIAVFGVTPTSLLAGIGSPWLLATTDCDSVTVPFVRLTRTYIPIMQSLFPVLENLVDVRNKKSIRWLKRLGFEFHEAEPHPYSGLLFCRFEMRLNDV